MFWIIVALLTATVAIVLMFPLMRGGGLAVSSDDGGVEVYRDQLGELQRELDSGQIGQAEAEKARAEIGRRLIAAAAGRAGQQAAPSDPRRRKAAALAVTIVLPLTALSLYLLLGSPGQPDMPLQARLENSGDDIGLLVARVERHLAQNPDDGAGFDLLAPIYARLGRLVDAELAYRNAIRLLGKNPERLAGFAETLVLANDGVVVEEARAALEAAERLRPGDPRIGYFLALALEQSGKKAQARAAFSALLQTAPAGAPWAALIADHLRNTGVDPAVLERFEEKREAVFRQKTRQNRERDRFGDSEKSQNDLAAPPGPDAGQIAAAAQMMPAERRDMIRGMVESLERKLKDNPGNIDGWAQLIRSYAVLNETAKAETALREGLDAFAADGAERRRLLALAEALGVKATGAPR